MAKGDIVAKLLLNSKDFDGKLAKSKKEISSMKGLGSQVFGGMASALKGFAVAAGAAVTVSEAFKAVVGSSQGLTDAWGRSLEATKTVFDNFVYSISNADFSSFENGLSAMIDKAREAYDAFDQLANTQMSANFVTTMDQSRYREAMTRARNKSLTKEERQAALDEAKGYAATISEASQKVAMDSKAALQKQFAAKLGMDASKVDTAVLEEAFRIDARFTSDEERKKINADFKAYKKMVKDAGWAEKEYWGIGKGFRFEKIKTADPEKAAKLRAEAEEKYMSSLVKYIALERLKDEELNAAMQVYASSVRSSNAAAEIITSTNEVQYSLNNEGLKKKVAAPVAAPQRTFALGKMQTYTPTMPGQTIAAGELPTTISSPYENEKINGWADAVFFDAEIKAMDEAGKKAETLPLYEKVSSPALVLESSPLMELFLGSADLVFSRSGGSSVAELALFGKNAVLIPYPYAAEGHQADNAAFYVQSGAGETVSDKEFTKERASEILTRHLSDPSLGKKREEAAKKAAFPQAAAAFLKHIENL